MSVASEIVKILERLVSFKTTADNPKAVKQAFGYINSLFDPDVFEFLWFEKNGKASLLIYGKNNDPKHPKILLNGHLDVVPAESEDQYTLRVNSGKALGRGACDMKGMLAVPIVVMQELAGMENYPNVALLITSDEEIGGANGVGYLVKEWGLRPEFVLCGDMMFEDALKIVVKEKGGLEIELVARGRSAHAAELWKGENAIEKVIAAVNKIKSFIGEVEPEAWKSTANLALLETSNKTFNKVPSDARAVLDIRFTESLAQTPQELFDKIKLLVPEVEVKIVGRMVLFAADPNHPLVQQLKTTAEKVAGREVPITFEHGASDLRYFAKIGVPGVIFGCIGDNAHAAEEWVTLESLETQKKIWLEFLKTVS